MIPERRARVAARRAASAASFIGRARWIRSTRARLTTLIHDGRGSPLSTPPRRHSMIPMDSRSWRRVRVHRSPYPAAAATSETVTRPSPDL
ncbi:hypothetical protein CBR64_00140 [Cellulosimicrobium cellulans]|uniref:Uncharacterized protein n=1 Tax=Cellulosimicrobium cellulans TaxID=1710 RepID=A0A1Y0HPY7_CELCE|nr:hypothetical protein CBR64_00140 [Cellulosimicrobium cellulans]